MNRGYFLGLIVVTMLFSYAIAIGTTFNGVLTPEFHLPTLIITALTIIAWLLYHWWRGWVWHRTPLDSVMLLWIAAFSLSLIANLESWRRISIGLWYVGIYIGVWYMLYDVIANASLSRETLIDALLISGVVVLIFGYLQCREWIANYLPLIQEGLVSFMLPRPVSTLGNTNLLSCFLIVLIPFIFVRILKARILFSRLMLSIYVILALFLLFLTFSRGAWLGLAAGMVVWFLLTLLQRNLLSVRAMRSWWSERTRGFKVIIVAIMFSGVVASFVIIFLFIGSLNQPGRTTGLRANIYTAAINLFLEKPLFGQGLFTFGKGLARMQSMPPETPHSHAHNAGLHIGAELGIVGLVALFVTLGIMAFTAKRNWEQANGQQRGILAGATGAVVAFAIHHLTDVPATAPAIALVGLVALVLMMVPPQPQPISSKIWRAAYSTSMVALWSITFITGVWSSRIYEAYVADLIYGIRTNDFRGSAERLQSVIDDDPGLSLYAMQQAFMLGMAANSGDLEAARQAVNVYEKFVTSEPTYAIVWANMGALYSQLGEQDNAVSAMRQAVELAPESWQLAVNLGNYEKINGDMAAADAAYRRAIEVKPDSILMPELQNFSLPDKGLTPPAQVVYLLDNGQIDQAEQIWKEYTPSLPDSSQPIIEMMLALMRNDRDAAQTAFNKAERAIVTETDEIWVHIGRAKLAQFDHDKVAATSELNTVKQMLERGLFEADFSNSLIGYVQFLMNSLPRDFLPQVYYPVDDPVLLYVFNKTLSEMQ